MKIPIPEESANPDELEAAAFEHDAAAATLRAKAKRLRRADVLISHVGKTPAAEPHMNRLQYARRSGISGATVTRLVQEGMPIIGVGTSYRIDPVAADAWRLARAKAPTRAKAKKETDPTDVDSAIDRAGLRVVR